MSKITSYTALTTTATDDVLPIVDVHDTTMAPTGTTKQITVANLLPAATTSTAGVVILDGTAGDIQASPGTAAAGNKGQPADAKHVHPSPSAFAPGGLTGATAASRYAGATASGAPVSGTFAVADWVIDQTGKIFICTTAGTPGTWTQVSGSGGSSLTVVPPITANPAPAVAGTFYPCDTSGGAFSVTLPSSSVPNGTVLGFKLVKQASGNAVTLNCGGSDVIDISGGSTSASLSILSQGKLLQYKTGSPNIWYVTSVDLPLSQLDLRYGETAASVTWSSATPAAIGPGAATPADVYSITLNHTTATITGITLTASAATVQGIEMYISQDSTGGTAIPGSAWPGSVTWLTGSAPTVATGANALTVISLTTQNAGTNWYGSVITGTATLPLTVPNGGTGDTSLTAYSVLAGGTTSAGALQQVSGVGTSGQVLTSNGASALPTWQAASGGLSSVPIVGAGASALGLGLLTIQPFQCISSIAITAQNQLLILVAAGITQTVTILGTWLRTAGGTASTGINGMAIYAESGGAALGTTGDMTSAFTGSTGFVEGTLGSGVAITAGSNYYLSLLTNLTSKPNLAGALAVANIPVLNGHYNSVFVASQTSFGSITPSSATLNSGSYLMYAR